MGKELIKTGSMPLSCKSNYPIWALEDSPSDKSELNWANTIAVPVELVYELLSV
jgi:hypothetical protein